MLKGKVDSFVKDGIGEICFSSEKANALDSNLLQSLISGIKQLSSDPECKVIYLSSVGRTFCAGAYFDELRELKSQVDAERFFSYFGEVTVCLREALQPVVVRLQGAAVGGGVGLVAAADLAFGLAESSVRLSEFEVGLGPFVISPVIEAKIGGARLMELALNGDSKNSDWCLATGLLSQISLNEQQLESDIRACLKRLGCYSLENTSKLKRIVTPSNLGELIKERAKFSAHALLRP